MDELESLLKEVTKSLVRYVQLNDEYNGKLPKAGKDIPSWTASVKSVVELDELGKKVNKARDEWATKLREYIERKNR